MGRVAAYLLGKYSGAEVSVSSRTEQKAAEAVREINKRIGKDVLRTQVVDVNSFDSMKKAMSNADIVVNIVGPYYRYGADTVKAAIESGTDYADICDELVAAKEILKLDGAAKKAGRTILTSLGSSPGLSNIQVQYSAKRMDTVSDVHIAWTSSQTDPFGPSVMKHCLHCYNNPHQYLGGELKQVPPFSGSQLVDFPQPVGRVEVVYFDHPEVLTIPKYVKGVKNVTVRGGIFPGDIHDLIRSWVATGLSVMDTFDVDGASISAVDFLTPVAMKIMQSKKGIPAVAAQRIEVIGKVNGQPMTHVHTSVGTMASGTILPLFIAVLMLAENKIREKGVLPPDALDSDAFFQEFKNRRHAQYGEIGKILDFRPVAT